MVPKAVLMRSGLVSLTTARPVNTAQPKTTVNSARPMTNVFNKAHSTVRRPINNKTATKNSNFNQKVNTTRPKAVLNAVKGNQVNAVKASACWVWKPKTKVLDHVSKHNSASITLKKFDYQDLQEKGVIDSGYSRHMTGNMSYLTDFEEINGGYIAFGGNLKGGKITRKEGGDSSKDSECGDQENEDNVNSTNTVNAASINKVKNMPELEDIVYSDDDEDVGAEADMNNLDTLVELPNGKKAIGTKWVFRNKKDKRGIVIKNEARLVTQGYTQEEGIDYDEVFAPVAKIEAIRLFLACASFKDFVVYQMDVKSDFLYCKIEEEVYVCQPPRFEVP
ncbi:putative ribonuclease H-like domain-containing protein [Tanacetum coccineum]